VPLVAIPVVILVAVVVALAGHRLGESHG
jgi:hypothetical protein